MSLLDLKIGGVVAQAFLVAFALWNVVAPRIALRWVIRILYKPGEMRRALEQGPTLGPGLVGLLILATMCAADFGLMPSRHS